MDSLQSRLDAEFLLAHMCSVKFKEWVVILATLLRRTEVCFNSSFLYDQISIELTVLLTMLWIENYKNDIKNKSELNLLSH